MHLEQQGSGTQINMKFHRAISCRNALHCEPIRRTYSTKRANWACSYGRTKGYDACFLAAAPISISYHPFHPTCKILDRV